MIRMVGYHQIVIAETPVKTFSRETENEYEEGQAAVLFWRPNSISQAING